LVQLLVIFRQALPVPWDFDIYADVIFVIEGYSTAAAASKNVCFYILHSPPSAGESWDVAFASVTTGDQLTNSAQDYLSSFAKVISNDTLGWMPGDQLTLKISRIEAGSNELSGSWGMTNFYVLVPTR